ncbi:MAG: DNA-formamidopyrimidine glycosylase family protein, partial [Alteraurantiacibacter sp.]
MPELPEAEANRRRIEDQCLNRTIEDASPGNDVTYIELPGDNERRRLVGRQFTETHRHGKLIFAGSKTGPWICVHLGMTGSLIPFDEDDEEQPDATKFLIRFQGQRALAYRCPRKLGWLRVVDSPEAEIERIGFGPDAMAIGENEFVEIIGGTNGAVKSALIEQKKIAGIGNLWSDEILFEIGILPDRKANDLDEATLRKMHGVMQNTLAAVMD